MRNEIINQKLIPLYGLIGILALLIVKIYNTAFSGGKFTCNRYILNTYLYILISLVIISLQNIVMEQQNVPVETIFKGIGGILLLFLLSLGLLYLLMSIDPRNVLLKHSVWLVFVLFLGILAYPSYLKTIQENTVIVTLMTTIFILRVFSSCIFKTKWISLSWGPWDSYFLGGIIGELCYYLFSKDKKVSGRSKAFSYFFDIIYSFYSL